MGTRVLFWGWGWEIKWLNCGFDHLLPFSAEVNTLIMDEARSTCNPHIFLHGVDWGNCTVSCVVKLSASLLFVSFSSFGFSTYMSSDITVFLNSSVM